MSVSWLQTITPWANPSPVSSGSFTPAAGDQIPVFALNGSGSGASITITGTGGYSSLASALNDSPTGKTLQPWANSSCSSGAQTITNTGTAGNAMYAWAFEYASAVSLSATHLVQANPGAGAGAILGTSVYTAAGAVLLAFCAALSTSAATLTSPSGTNRGSGTLATIIPYCVTEYTGAGANITPSFTCSVGASNRFYVAQILLTPPSVGGGSSANNLDGGLNGGFQ